MIPFIPIVINKLISWIVFTFHLKGEIDVAITALLGGFLLQLSITCLFMALWKFLTQPPSISQMEMDALWS